MNEMRERLNPAKKAPVMRLVSSLRDALLLLSGVLLLLLLVGLVAEFPNLVRYLRVRQM